MKSNEHPLRLLAYLDGELSDEEFARVERHLAGCEICEHELAAHRQLHARLDAATQMTVRGDLWPELQPRLHRAGGAFRPRLAGAVYGLMILVGLGFGGWAGWNTGEEFNEEASPELLAETSLYDLPEYGFTREYLELTVSNANEEDSQ